MRRKGGANEIDSLFDASTLTSGMSIAWAIDGSRMARNQKAGTSRRLANLRPKQLLSARTQRQLQG
jgi:hypothetical protein